MTVHEMNFLPKQFCVLMLISRSNPVADVRMQLVVPGHWNITNHGKKAGD
jgi:hypothetical protein